MQNITRSNICQILLTEWCEKYQTIWAGGSTYVLLVILYVIIIILLKCPLIVSFYILSSKTNVLEWSDLELNGLILISLISLVVSSERSGCT